MAEWRVERGIGEDRALLMEGERVLAARLRWPGELAAGTIVFGNLLSRAAGSARGVARTEGGEDVLVDRIPKDIGEGGPLAIAVRRAAVAERGRLKRALGRCVVPGQAPEDTRVDAFAGECVRRFPAGAWEDVWGAAWDREFAFAGGTLLLDVTPGMIVIDIDGTVRPRELALAAVPAIARAVQLFELGGSIAIDFPTLAAKADRQAVDRALDAALEGWPHDRTAMNGFGLVHLVARLEGPSLLHRLALHRASAAARFLLRQAEATPGAGAILLTAHPVVLAGMRPEWLAELARRAGREVVTQADGMLAIGGGHSQIVAR